MAAMEPMAEHVDGREAHVAAAFASLPTFSGVEARFSPERGCSLHVASIGGCIKDDVLLSVPLAMCLVGKGTGKGIVTRLLKMISGHESGHKRDERATYWLGACPSGHFDAFMQNWPADSIAAGFVSNTVAWRRAQAWRAETEAEHRSMHEKTGLRVSLDRLKWAKLLVQSRTVLSATDAFAAAPAKAEEDVGGESNGESDGDDGRWVLCPLLDMANHQSFGASARVVVTDSAVQLVATRALSSGDEATVNSDPEADHSDIFERLNCFDATATVHTAEVVVPPLELAELVRGSAWRRDLVEAEASRGSDQKHDAWWVPDHRFDACPLFSAVRATLVGPEELTEGLSWRELLCAPIAKEAEACARLSSLLESHLKSYEHLPACDEAGDGDMRLLLSLGCEARAALRFARMERSLLATVHRTLIEGCVEETDRRGVALGWRGPCAFPAMPRDAPGRVPASTALCGDLSPLLSALRADGFVRLNGVLDDAQLVSSLERHVRDEVASARRHGLHEERLPAALEPSRRCDALLDLPSAPSPVTEALSSILVASRVRRLLHACLGPRALLWELSAMTSSPGARPQPVHPDTLWRSSEPTALVVFVALSSISRAMGPTTFLPGTHTADAHEVFHRQGAAAAARLVGRTEAEAPLLEWGDALVMDTRVLHCGGANRSSSERTLFYFTFRRAGEPEPALRHSSLREGLRDQFSLEDVVECVSRAERAANPTATDRVRMAATSGRTQ